MKCPVCSTPLAETDRFCPQCGRAVTQQTVETTAPEANARQYDELRVVDTTRPAEQAAPALAESAWPRLWPRLRTWIAAVALLAAVLGVLLPFYRIRQPQGADYFSGVSMMRAELAALNLTELPAGARENLAAAAVFGVLPTDWEQATARFVLAGLALGPLWLLLCAALLAMPLLRGSTPRGVGGSLALLWVMFAWCAVYLLGMRLGLWLDLFRIAGAGLWCSLAALVSLDLVRRF